MSNNTREVKTITNNLWEQVGNLCLTQTLDLLQKEVTPTAATVEVTKGLVEIAVMIDSLNLRWVEQNRSGAAVSMGSPFSQRQGEN